MSEDTPQSNPAKGTASPSSRNHEQLFSTLYADLRRLANRELQRHPGVSVSATTLVHEAYVNLAGRENVSFEDQARFLGYIARAMRGLILDYVRKQRALKRGAQFHITQLTTQVGEEIIDTERLARLSDALDALGVLDPRLAEVVDLKYFCGLSFAEIAALRCVSERTVQRDWDKARMLLYQHIDESGQ